MTRGNGNGSEAKCIRCRAVELGLSGRPLTQDELVLLHGGVVEPTRENRVEWAPDTVEAAISVDAAQGAYQAAREVFAEVRASADSELERLRRKDAPERHGREIELQAAVDAAWEDLGEVEERLRAVRRHHRELSRRDSEAHRVALGRANAVRRSEEREAAKAASRKGVLARFWS